MSHKYSRFRRHSAEMKALISAAAVAATLGGWAALANEAPPPIEEAVVAQSQPQSLPPVPTLVPLGSALPQERSAASVAPPASPLRDVSALPAAPRPRPIAVTRSSR